MPRSRRITFPASDSFKVAAAATAATDAPYQWVLRRMFLGRLLDSDKVYYPENGGFKLVELAPNVQHGPGRHGQQPDRRHEGWAGDLRRAG